jgi:xylulokinase
LKLQVINESKSIQKEVIVNYDSELPHYNTVNGVIRHSLNGVDHISTPTLLFVEALEMAIERLQQSGSDLSTIKAISGSGQQHGSVWWKTSSINTLRNVNNTEKLHQQLSSAFSLSLSPIWMDSSTTIECQEITNCNFGCLNWTFFEKKKHLIFYFNFSDWFVSDLG